MHAWIVRLRTPLCFFFFLFVTLVKSLEWLWFGNATIKTWLQGASGESMGASTIRVSWQDLFYPLSVILITMIVYIFFYSCFQIYIMDYFFGFSHVIWTWLIFYSNKLFNYLYFFNSLYVSIWWCGSNSFFFFFFVVFLILIYMFLICPQTLSIPWDVGYYNNHLHNSPLSAYFFDSFIPNV